MAEKTYKLDEMIPYEQATEEQQRRVKKTPTETEEALGAPNPLLDPINYVTPGVGGVKALGSSVIKSGMQKIVPGTIYTLPQSATGAVATTSPKSWSLISQEVKDYAGLFKNVLNKLGWAGDKITQQGKPVTKFLASSAENRVNLGAGKTSEQEVGGVVPEDSDVKKLTKTVSDINALNAYRKAHPDKPLDDEPTVGGVAPKVVTPNQEEFDPEKYTPPNGMYTRIGAMNTAKGDNPTQFAFIDKNGNPIKPDVTNKFGDTSWDKALGNREGITIRAEGIPASQNIEPITGNKEIDKALGVMLKKNRETGAGWNLLGDIAGVKAAMTHYKTLEETAKATREDQKIYREQEYDLRKQNADTARMAQESASEDRKTKAAERELMSYSKPTRGRDGVMQYSREASLARMAAFGPEKVHEHNQGEVNSYRNELKDFINKSIKLTRENPKNKNKLPKNWEPDKQWLSDRKQEWVNSFVPKDEFATTE